MTAFDYMNATFRHRGKRLKRPHEGQVPNPNVVADLYALVLYDSTLLTAVERTLAGNKHVHLLHNNMKRLATKQ